MKKKLLFIIFLLAATCHIAAAKAPRRPTRFSKQPTAEIKWGLYSGNGLKSFPVGTLFVGIFGIYKFNEAVGVQMLLTGTGGQYFLRSVAVSNGKDAWVMPFYISLPILARFYPGDDRQFCWFGGLHLGYLVGGFVNFYSNQDAKNLSTQKQSRTPDAKIYEIKEQDKVRKFLVDIEVGCDYELENGFMLGLGYTQGLINVIEAAESYWNWALYPIIGYNFGSLCKKSPSVSSVPNRISKQRTGKIKFGLSAGSGSMSRHVDIFGEYAFNKALGVQIALSGFTNMYNLHGGLSLMAVSNGESASARPIIISSGEEETSVIPIYISLPILARFYPGSDRQFCWFGGIRLGYLIGGEAEFIRKHQTNINQYTSSKVALTSIKEQDKVRKLLVGMVAGCDYEFGFGLILGLSYTKGLINVIEATTSEFNWNFNSVIGYNFGVLLK